MTELVSVEALMHQGVIALQTGPFGSQLHSYDYVPVGVPVVPTEGIKGGRLDHSVLPHISIAKAEELSRHFLQENDILFARRGAQATGRTARVRLHESGFICGTGAIRARVQPRQSVLDAQFFGWFLAAPGTISWIREQAIGATMPNLNEGILKRIRLPLLPIIEQREIAAILGALDDKIELNRKTAATLEEMARALYRSWFVDFDPVCARAEGRSPAHMDATTAALFPDSFCKDGLPLGWRVGTLGEVARNPRTTVDPSKIGPETPYIGLEHIPRRSISISDWGRADDVGSAKCMMQKGQFLFGKLRPYFHKVGIVPITGICSTDILVVEAKSSMWREFVLSVISSVELVEHVNAASTGTRMPRAKWQDLANYNTPIACEAVVQAFSDVIAPLYERISPLILENHTLATLRDTLLPRLMSGELCVGATRELVEEVA